MQVLNFGLLFDQELKEATKRWGIGIGLDSMAGNPGKCVNPLWIEVNDLIGFHHKR